MISVFKYLKHSSNKIKLSFRETFSYDFKDVLFNKFNKLKGLYTSPNEVEHLQDLLTKQERLEKLQDERREIGKQIIDARKKSIIIQEKIFQTNKWENVQQYVNLRKEEADLIIEEKKFTAKFEDLDKIEKELMAVLGYKVRHSYEKVKAKKVYTKYWVAILSSVIFLYIGRLVYLIYLVDNDNNNKITLIYEYDSDKSNIMGISRQFFLILVGVAIMAGICGCC